MPDIFDEVAATLNTPVSGDLFDQVAATLNTQSAGDLFDQVAQSAEFKSELADTNRDRAINEGDAYRAPEQAFALSPITGFVGGGKDDIGADGNPALTLRRLGGAVVEEAKEGVKDIVPGLRSGKVLDETFFQNATDDKLIEEYQGGASLNSQRVDELRAAGVPYAEAIRRAGIEGAQQAQAGFKKTEAALEGAFPVDPAYDGKSSGTLEDITRGVSRSLPGMAATAVQPVVGLGILHEQIAGQSFSENEKKGADPQRNAIAANTSAAIQAPLESAGNLVSLGAITRAFKGNPLGAKLVDLTRVGAAEGLEEVLQGFPEDVANYWTKNPESTLADAAKATGNDPNLLARTWERAWQGAAGGVLLAGAGQTAGGAYSLGKRLTEKSSTASTYTPQPPPVTPKDPATVGFWNRVNGTLESAPERRFTSDELEMEAQTSPALKAFVATHDALVNNGRLDLAGKLSITDLARDDDAAPSLALNLSGLSPDERNQVYALAAQNGLSNNVDGAAGRLTFVGEGASFAPVVSTTSPTNLLNSSTPTPQPKAEPSTSLADRIIQAESNGNPNAQAGTSSARGLGQFTEGTRNAILQRHGVDAWSSDPAEQRRATEILIEANRRSLNQSLGREPTDGEVYMAHFLGSGGAKQFLPALSQAPNDAAINHVSAGAAAANKSIFYSKDGQPRTVQQVYDLMARKVGGGQTVSASPAATTAQPGQTAPTQTGQPGVPQAPQTIDLLTDAAPISAPAQATSDPLAAVIDDIYAPNTAPLVAPQPEPQAYIDAQVQAMADPNSSKRAVLVTPGSPLPTNLPPGTQAFLTQHGTVLTSDPQLIRTLPYEATDEQMGAAVLNWERGRPATVTGGEVIRALDANGVPVGEVHVLREDVPKALEAMRGLSPVSKAVRVPLKKALADRERLRLQDGKRENGLRVGIEKLTKRLAVTREPRARLKLENEREALEFQLRDLRGETAPVLTPEEQARAQAIRQRPALPVGIGFERVGQPQDFSQAESATMEPFAQEALAAEAMPAGMTAEDSQALDRSQLKSEGDLIRDYQAQALADADARGNELLRYVRGRLDGQSIVNNFGPSVLEDLRGRLGPGAFRSATNGGVSFDVLEAEAKSQGLLSQDADLVDALQNVLPQKSRTQLDASRGIVNGQREVDGYAAPLGYAGGLDQVEAPVNEGPMPEESGLQPVNSDGTLRADGGAMYRPGELSADQKKEMADKFSALEPVRITGKEIADMSVEPLDINILREKAKNIVNQEGFRTEVQNVHDKSKIQITKNGIKNSLSHGAGPEKVQAVAAIPDLLERAVPLGPKQDASGKPLVKHIYAAKLNIGGRDFTVGLVVREDSRGNRFYDHEMSSLEADSSQQRAATQKAKLGNRQPPRDSVMDIVREALGVNADVQFKKGQGQPNNGVSAAAVREALASTPYSGAEVLNHPGELDDPRLFEQLRRTGNLGARGTYNPMTGKAYVFANNHADLADAIQTARDELHHQATFRWAEQMARDNPKAGPAFKQLNAFMAQVRLAKRSAINEWLDANGYGELKNQNYGAAEWLTHAASKEAPKWHDRYVAAVVEFFRKLGKAVGIDFKMTEAEIRNWNRTVEGMIGEEVGQVESPQALYRKATNQPTFTQDGLPNETIQEWIVRKMQDRMNRLTKTVKVLGERAGEPLPDHVDAALRENLYQGRTEERLRQFEVDHVKPLIEAIKTADVSLSDVEDALYAMHAKRRNMVIADRTRGENVAGSGITDAQADQIMDDLRASGKLAKVFPIVRRVWNINKARLALLKSSGLESEETLRMWRETYGENYVPLKSGSDAKGDLKSVIMGTDKPQRQRTGRGYDIRGRESQHATGRHTEAGNILANIMAQYETTIIRAEKNRIGQAFLQMAQDNLDPKLWEVDETPLKTTFNVKTGEVETKRDPRYKLADNVFSVKVDGQEHLITIKDDVLAGAMKNLGAETSHMLLRIFASYNRAMSLLNTSLDPEFVVSNFLRDLQTANLNLTAENQTALAKQITKDTLSGGPVKGIYRALREKSSAANDEWSQWFERYRKAGGKIGFFGLRSVEDQAKRLEGMLSEANGGAWASTKQGLRSVGDFIGDANGAVENGLRLAAFRRSVEAGLSEERAANLAKELTVNFNKRGEAGTVLNALYLFANVSIQGNARILKALVTTKRGAVLAGSIIAGSVALAALNRQAGGEDDDGQSFYDKIDSGVKSRNLVLMKWWKSDGSYLTLPLPYGYNALKVVGDQIESLAMGKQTVLGAAWKMTSAFVDAFNPLGTSGTVVGTFMPTIARPFIDIATNTDFGGNPITPTQPKFGPTVPESQLAWSSVSKPAKWVAEELNRLTGGSEKESGKLDYSPEVIEHLWSTYTGGVARFINRAVNLGMNAYQGTEPATKDIPFARRLMGEQSPYVTPKQFREASDIIQRKQGAYMDYRKTDPERAKAYRQDNLEELAMVPKLNDAEKAMKPLVTKRNEIKGMEVSDAQKALLLKPVESQMATIQKAFLREYLERDASPQEIQKADKTFTLEEAQAERAQILADYHKAIQDGNVDQAEAIASKERQQYNDKVRGQHLPVQFIRGSTLRGIRRTIKHGPSKSAKKVTRYLNTYDEEDNDE